MECEAAQELIGAEIDRELDGAQRAVLDAHLAACDECRDAAEALRRQDAALLRSFQPDREASARLAERVIAALPAVVKATNPKSSIDARYWVSLMLAAAIGFLLALLLTRPHPQSSDRMAQLRRPAHRTAEQPAADALAATEALPVAQLTAATGQVEFSAANDGWERVPAIEAFACPTEGAVRTPADVRAELVTEDGCVIRMDGETSVKFRTGRSIELQQGQIWCRSPDDVALEVAPAESASAPSRKPVRVTTAGGRVSLKTRSGIRHLAPDETATVVGDAIESEPPRNPLLSASWMQPLLIRKGHGDRELSERVDQLLAQIGRTKLSTLYEQEIRSLGEYCVLPLARYVQSPGSMGEIARRLTAMQIVSDLAPAWAIGDLIVLLEDAHPEVRFLAATALERLTGLDQGRTPTDWRDANPPAEAVARWQTWWIAHRDRFPDPAGLDSRDR